MTYEDWCSELGYYIVNAQWHGADRMGQWLYSFLNEYRPDITSAITGGAYDPFYDDRRIGAFMQHVKELW